MFLEFKKAQTKAQHQGIAEHHRQKENNHSFQREETGLTKVKKHVVRGLLEKYWKVEDNGMMTSELQ